LVRAIHQFLAGFSNGDAISNEALVMRDIFRSWGYQSDIFSEPKRILPELRKQARDAAAYASVSKPDDIVLLHLSIGSPVNAVFSTLPCRKAILYHNATPSHYLDFINKNIAYNLAAALNQIRSLANTAEINMADSKFNADDLIRLGYAEVKVLPLILDFDALRSAPDRKVLKKFGDGKTNVLFVGRCVPNKKIEDVLKAFFYFQKFVEPNSRFIHVGSFAGTERYYFLLLAQTREIGLQCANFVGAVPQAQLNAIYRCADIFLCMSEHEGFCIPLIESMVYDVPVVAFAAAAVPETMGGAGVLFQRKQFEMIAEIMGRLTHDTRLRAAVLKGQQERLTRYTSRDLKSELKDILQPLLTT